MKAAGRESQKNTSCKFLNLSSIPESYVTVMLQLKLKFLRSFALDIPALHTSLFGEASSETPLHHRHLQVQQTRSIFQGTLLFT